MSNVQSGTAIITSHGLLPRHQKGLYASTGPEMDRMAPCRAVSFPPSPQLKAPTVPRRRRQYLRACPPHGFERLCSNGGPYL